ncbi:MAG: UDP-N-acetylglucosamine--N-acetylmuramyl-(pentapeptide) pyrophosphoryl-undecaprenol N-acetylglucosamine transferase [Treponemataceae bacterium]
MKNCIAFTGGGTGGHIYPGLAIADFFKSDESCNVSIIWIGNNTGIDKKIISKNTSIDKFYGIPCGKLRRYFSLQNFFDIFKIFFGFSASFFILLRHRPSFLFSKGGFVSVPPCFAAYLLKIPVYTHECDFSPGLATKLNAKIAKTIFLSYTQTKDFFSQSDLNLVVVGNPIRQEFYTADKNKGFHFLGIQGQPPKPIVLVLGGSSGAKQINDLIIENILWLCKHFIIVHQTGKHFDPTILKNQNLIHLVENKNYIPHEFIFDSMCNVLACADIVISRSGANALWEAATCLKAMILIPLSGSGTRGDQVENAAFFVEKNAAYMLQDKEVNSQNLQKLLMNLTKKTEREKLTDALNSLVPKKNPAKKIYEILKNELLN